MIVFHTSYTKIEKPDLVHSRRCLDFGKGFYVTPLRAQALRYGKKFIRNAQPAVLNRYELKIDESLAKKHFEKYDEEWLDFILACRRGEKIQQYDIIEGGIANDKVFNTIELYTQNLISKQETLSKLSFEKPNWQICFASQRAIDLCLQFKNAEQIKL